MTPELKITADGSPTLYLAELDEHYHSYHGALQESLHVFIDHGYRKMTDNRITILEYGLGTGLNLMCTLAAFLKDEPGKQLHYISLEKYPISAEQAQTLAYAKHFDFEDAAERFQQIHHLPWGERHELLPNFSFTKHQCDFMDIDQLGLSGVNLVYFDAFGARVQPELWELPIFEKMNKCLAPQALLSTYSAKGSLKRILKSLGFELQMQPGPHGKREMTNAWKK
jgi:tRNA U34 5-methylaminomethyl-2-thiouridine-forming methyltransferase MnmC